MPEADAELTPAACTAANTAGVRTLVLFDGTSLQPWCTPGGGPARWQLRQGALEIVPGAGDVVSRSMFCDFQLHLEFWLPHMPHATGQDRANSGVYLQGRYELQILDSYGQPPADDSCGAIYHVRAPIVNACAAPETWQRLEVAFRAPRLDSTGFVAEHARVTALLNGIMIQDNVPLPGPTEGPLDRYEAQPGPIRLQDHGCPVRFRNIWVLTTMTPSEEDEV